MPRINALPLLCAAAVLALGACGSAQRSDPVSTPAPAHPAGAEQLGEEPRIEAAPPVAVAPTLLGSARYDLPVEANQWVQGELDFLVNQRHDVIGTWLHRADYYQPWVKEVFGAAGVPQDLSHLAMVESGFLPTARSHAGAVGMWQFMAGTGRGMGLRVDEIVDERMDPVRSTRAAARHLRDLNQAFNGDWALAIAAYNAGTGRISRGLRTYNVGTFWELAQAGNLAEETKRYVPRLYAVTVIAHEPSRFGYAAPTGPVRRFAFDSVRVDVMTPLSQLAETGGVPLGDLVELNPHLVRGTAPADYWVWTPKGTGEAVQTAFNTSEFRRSGGYGYYVVRAGDDFTKLAAAAGLSVDQVRAMNPRLDASGMTRGQRLVFPVGVATMLASRPVERVAVEEPEHTGRRRSGNGSANGNNRNAGNNSADSSDDSSSSDDFSRAASAGSRSTRTASADRSADAPAARTRRDDGAGDGDRPARTSDARPRTFEHTVKRGETLQSLADRFDVPPSRIVSINGLETRRVRAGQVLRIPRPADEQSAASDRPSRASSQDDAPAAPRPFVHTVARGETLAGLAERFEVTPSRIRALNEMEAGARVRPGQKLRIPRNADETTARATSDGDAPRTSRAQSQSADSDTPSRSTRSSGDGDARPRAFEHTVKRGETLQSLADRFDVPPSRLRALNELETGAHIRPGQVLRIPRAGDAQTARSGDSDAPARSTRTSSADSDSPARSTRSSSADGDAPARSTRSQSADADAPARTSRTASARDAEVRTFTHEVKRGETLQSLAERFDVPPSRIRALNGMEAGERVTPGQSLRIPRPADEQPASRRASTERTADSESPSRGTSTRRASTDAGAGEGSSSTRRRSSETTASASKQRDGSGDGDSERPSTRTASTRRAESDEPSARRSGSSGESGASSRSGSSERSASADRSSAARRSGDGASSRAASAESRPRYTEHTVKAGETLYSLARRYSVSVTQLRSANDIGDGESLGIGRKLRIPATSDR